MVILTLIAPYAHFQWWYAQRRSGASAGGAIAAVSFSLSHYMCRLDSISLLLMSTENFSVQVCFGRTNYYNKYMRYNLSMISTHVHQHQHFNYISLS